jgi:GTP-binding protein HflX
MTRDVTRKPARAVIAAVHLTGTSDAEFEASLAELRQLAKTLGFEVVATFTQNRAAFDASAYLGVGKREEVRDFVQDGAELVLVDHEISRHFGVQIHPPMPAIFGGQQTQGVE